MIHDHDVVFWFGDLNYRINAEDMGLYGDQVREIASGKDYRTLLKYDQVGPSPNSHLFHS